MADTTHVKGLKDLVPFLQQFPKKIVPIMRGAFRAGMTKRVKPNAQARIHNVSGLLSKGLKVGTKTRGGQVIANLKATGPHASVAHLVEWGTSSHVIRAKIKKALTFGEVITREVQHPGSKPQAFMLPALDTQAQAAVIESGEYIKKRLTKEGLNVGHVMVEGDE
jgi:hypothetical protein